VRTFLKETESDLQQVHARIVKDIQEKEAERERDLCQIKFLSEFDGDTANEIFTFNKVIDYNEK
jgi:hypothetical protein